VSVAQIVTVLVLRNGRTVASMSATDLGPVKDTNWNRYRLDAGATIQHDPDDGVVDLAIKMLNLVEGLTPGQPARKKPK